MICRIAACLIFCSAVCGAQSPSGKIGRSDSDVVGIIVDSLSQKPISGATVQLLRADDPSVIAQSTTSDSTGGFALTHIPVGHYSIGFVHPLLDSLGVDTPVHDLNVAANDSYRLVLGTPSPTSFRRAVCGQMSDDRSAGVLIGTAYDAITGSALSGVQIVGQWMELSISNGGMTRRFPRLTATTGNNGWFAMCNVPSDGTVVLSAVHGADSTPAVEVQISSHGFGRQDIYVGSKATTLGRLSGVVLAAATGKPVPGAQINVATARTVTGINGEWTILRAPLGTRNLEVRALGYYPQRHQVQVVRDSRPLRLSLSTMKAVLDTIRVNAAHRDSKDTGFEKRRRSGVGRYLSAEDIARHPVLLTSDIFRNTPGLKMERNQLGESFVSMRGRSMNRCSPAVFIDGHYLRDLSADSIDDWVRPSQIAGIEIYPEGTVPAEFDMGAMATVSAYAPDPSHPDGNDSENVTEPSNVVVNSCGSIVIWTK